MLVTWCHKDSTSVKVTYTHKRAACSLAAPGSKQPAFFVGRGLCQPLLGRLGGSTATTRTPRHYTRLWAFLAHICQQHGPFCCIIATTCGAGAAARGGVLAQR